MDLDTAAGHLEAAPRVTLLPEVRERLAAHHAEHPQRALLAQHAMDMLEQALAHLAGLGHVFHLAEGAAAPPAEFPKMMYRDSADGLLHETAEDARAEAAMAKDGWRDTPALEARKRKP